MAEPKIHFAPLLSSERLTYTLLDLGNQDDLAYVAEALNLGGAGPLSSKGVWDAEETRKLSYSVMMKPSDSHGHLIKETPIYLVHLGSSPGEKIGMINLCRRVPHIPMDIGFIVDEKYRQKGYGTEAAGRVLRYWTEEFGLKEICLITGFDNIAANKLAHNINFVDGGWVSYGGGKTKAYVLPGMKQFNGEEFSFWGDGEIPLDDN